METFKPIVGFEGLYEISDLGNVRSLTRKILHVSHSGFCSESVLKGKLMRICVGSRVHSEGSCYPIVSLAKDGVRKSYVVHRLIALTFLPNHNPLKIEVNHKDGVKTNNILTNLEWVTPSENCLHSFRIGTSKSKTGKEHHFAKLKRYHGRCLPASFGVV